MVEAYRWSTNGFRTLGNARVPDTSTCIVRWDLADRCPVGYLGMRVWIAAFEHTQLIGNFFTTVCIMMCVLYSPNRLCEPDKINNFDPRRSGLDFGPTT